MSPAPRDGGHGHSAGDDAPAGAPQPDAPQADDAQPGTAPAGSESAAQPWAIRRATVADVDAIMALETSTFTTDAWSRSMMLSDLGQQHCYYLVAEQPGHPHDPLLGYAGLLSPRKAVDADVQTIAVAPDARRLGLGSTLMNLLIAEAASRGARRVFLEVRADNPGAQHLYETLGFLPIGVRRGYYQPDNVDAVVMRLELAEGRS